jgi:hypothetical protein
MNIDQVWLAWTEDDSDSVAKQLRAIESKLKIALQLTAARMRATPALRGRARGLDALLSFGGDPLAANYSTQLGDIMHGLVGRGDQPAQFLRPGPPTMELHGMPHVRAYALGPPRDVSKIKAMNDPGGETYRQQMALARSRGFVAAIDHHEGGRSADDDTIELAQPFEPHLRLSPEEARRDPFFVARYGFGDRDPLAWRRIDHDWLGTSEELAIQLDSYTNNSSLAFALELGDPGPVLLFAADAQVGNWLSWHEHTWKVPRPGGGERTVTAADLLARTVLYKVGHHGSENATLKARGLELMTSPELAAMIPTDEAWAKRTFGWEMPFKPLATRLKEQTRGRVIRADSGLPATASLAASVRTGFKKKARETALYVEYDVAMG